MNTQIDSINSTENASISHMPPKWHSGTHRKNSGNYDLDEVIFDVGNIKDMLSVIRHLMCDLDYGVGENRNYPLQRISSMVEVTAAISERTFEAILDNNSDLKAQIARRHA